MTALCRQGWAGGKYPIATSRGRSAWDEIAVEASGPKWVGDEYAGETSCIRWAGGGDARAEMEGFGRR